MIIMLYVCMCVLYYFIILLFYYFIILSFYYFIILLLFYYYFIILSFYYFIILLLFYFLFFYLVHGPEKTITNKGDMQTDNKRSADWKILPSNDSIPNLLASTRVRQGFRNADRDEDIAP